jgi:hypothetical protein
MIFTNSSFANNRDLFSQIDYVICLTNSKHVNIVHWSSIKCKRVTRSVLAAELYALTHDFDLDAALKATLSALLDHFVLLILCTDSKSLYDCLVKLDTTTPRNGSSSTRTEWIGSRFRFETDSNRKQRIRLIDFGLISVSTQIGLDWNKEPKIQKLLRLSWRCVASKYIYARLLYAACARDEKKFFLRKL